jgi:hypothetical protein
MTPSDDHSDPASSPDPILARRAAVAHWTLLANRIGWLLLALAVALFVVAFMVGFNPTMATLVMVVLMASFVLLAPSIVMGYAVRAADRADDEELHRGRRA